MQEILDFFSTGKCLFWGYKALEPNPREDPVNKQHKHCAGTPPPPKIQRFIGMKHSKTPMWP